MGRTAEVNPFTPDYKSMQVPIIDAAVQYECPYSGMLHVYVSMRHNLVPPFMTRKRAFR